MGATLLGCSSRHPLCVHLVTRAARPEGRDPAPRPLRRPAPRDVPESARLSNGQEVQWLARTLAAAEAVLDRGLALGLPPAPTDDGRGGSDAYDLYLDSAASGVATWPDPLEPLVRFDRASSFVVLPPPDPRPSCRVEIELARCLGEAALLGLDGAAHPSTLRMQASYLATLLAPCLDAELDAVDRAQRSPEISLAGDAPDRLAGTLLFPWYLDAAYGTGAPGAVMTALFALSQQRSEPTAERLRDEPDVFDALRRAATDRGTTLDDVLLDFAVARAFVGSRSDGAHLPGSERLGDFGRPRFEWSVPYPTLPRRLGPARPIEPTGASYLWLELEDAPSGSQLLFQAEWEQPTAFAWALVKVDRQGIEVGRLQAPAVYGNDRVQLTVADLEGLAGLLVVGTNLGIDDRSHPFDPDEPLAPAEYSVTLAAPMP
jgi:hypothetical protein